MITFYDPNEDPEDIRDAEEALAELGDPIAADMLWAEIEAGDDDRSVG